LRRRYGLAIRLGPEVAATRHAITYRRLELRGFRAHLIGPPLRASGRWRWVARARAAALARSSAWSKLLADAEARGVPDQTPRPG
jgi:hypothetical protein